MVARTWPRSRASLMRLPLVCLGSCVLLLGGCDNLLRSIVGVPAADSEIRFPDGGFGVDGDADIPNHLTLTAVRPTHGPFIGGNTVQISGSGFGGGMVIRIGGREVQVGEITVRSPVLVEVVVPAGEVGPADVEVKTADEAITLPDAYTYDPVALEPDAGPTAGGTLVTIQGKDTSFEPGIKLEIGGLPLTDVEVISATLVRGKTQAHAEGPVDLVLGTASGDVTIADAFRYYAASDPLRGGLGGGEIQGTVTVSVLNWFTRQPVPGAKVYLQKDRTLALSGQTDAQGTIVFSDTRLGGPVTVTAAAEKHETASIVDFDARDVTIFLYPIVQPQPGALPPGQRIGLIDGFVLFGGSTGAGSTQWKIVPEPKVGQKKRVYVYATNSSIRFGPPTADPQATISFDPGDATAWPFSLYSRLGSLAVYAIAGLYNEGSGSFEPYAMGITRGLVVGPGDRLAVNVLVNIPLTEKVTVELAKVPQAVNRHRVRLAIDLGAEGVILRDDTEIEADGIPASFGFGRLPALTMPGLTDATYTLDVLLDNGSDAAGLPLVRATSQNVNVAAGKVLIDDWVGPPTQVKPVPGGPLQGNTLAWSYSGGASLAMTMIVAADETPVWRIISAGDVTEVKLPDPVTVGLPAWPAGGLIWLQWQARLPNYNYDTFNYSHLSSQFWDRWSYDEFAFKVQAP